MSSYLRLRPIFKAASRQPRCAKLIRSQLATNFGDTLASELGILASSQPYYILTFERVPAGTNGGVSLYGLVMSALGGAAIGLVMVIDLMIERTCYGTGWAVEMILFGTAAGFLGSMASPPSCQSDIACLVAVKAAYVRSKG